MQKILAKSLYRAISNYRGENVYKYLPEYRDTEKLKSDALENHQLGLLKRLVTVAAKSVPFYEEQLVLSGLVPDKLENLEGLERYPIISKESIQESPEEFANNNYKDPSYWVTTGGSMGRPLRIIKSAEGLGRRRAAMYRFYEWWGIEVGDKQARFWGIPLDLAGKLDEKRKDKLMNRRRFNAFELSPDNYEKFYGGMKKFSPKYFYGFVSAIFEFAKYVRDTGLDGSELGLDAIIVTSETVYPDQRVTINEAFGAPVVAEYGAGEVGIIGFECRKGRMHVNADSLILEVVDGRAVITDLYSAAMPLIRYDLGDVLTVSDEECECGCGFPVIEYVSGREVDMIDMGEGKTAHAQALNYVFQDFNELRRAIRQFRVVQKAEDGALEIQVIPNDYYELETEQVIESVIRERLGFPGRISIKAVADIPHDASGKLRYFVKERERDDE
ncbi:MAG: phenylacetate--CoA ligase family protein [bacterium]|nr:phenylacetate--CoA ligase family protein [bacterium]